MLTLAHGEQEATQLIALRRQLCGGAVAGVARPLLGKVNGVGRCVRFIFSDRSGAATTNACIWAGPRNRSQAGGSSWGRYQVALGRGTVRVRCAVYTHTPVRLSTNYI